MEKELFRISINLETENREFIESDYKTTLEWNKDEYDAELINLLSVALGMKIGATFKSEKVRNEVIAKVCTLITNYCNKM